MVVGFPEPRRLATQLSPGTPLVALGGVLAGAPLQAEELTALAAPAGAHVLCVGGEARVVRASERQPVDPAAWIDLGGYARPVPQTLGDPPRPVVVEAPAPQPARARFSVPAPSAAAEGLVQAVMAAAAARAAKSSPPGEEHPYRRPERPADEVFATRFGLSALALAGVVAVALIAPALALPAAALAALAAAGKLGGAKPSAPGRGAPPRRPEIPPPPAAAGDGAWNRLKRWLSRKATGGALGRMLGRKHAQILNELFELLDRGDVDEALRRAIPLGKGPGGGDSPLWGSPGRRDSIHLSPVPRGGAASSIFADDPILAALRQRYRSLFERLDAQGKIDEAAFVLGELLGDWAEAVTYLERKERFRLAAEVAEGHRLDPGLVVHLWLRAGEPARAVLVARARHAFAAAIERLQKRGTTLDHVYLVELRRLWADELAQDGDLLGAFRAVEPVFGQLGRDTRERALAWLRDGADLEGPPGAVLLAKALGFDTAERARWRDRALALAADLDPGRRVDRFAFLKALVGERADSTRVVARAATRLLLVEAEVSAETRRLALELARHASDAVLLADLPALAAPEEPGPQLPVHHVFDARDRGQLPAKDVAWLADGRVLVALGEIGVRVVTRKATWLVPEPAHALVVSPSGTRVLALAPRDESTRVARVDLERRTSAPWAELHLRAHTTALRNGLWAVATGPRTAVSLLDVERERPTAVFQVDQLGSTVLALAHDEAGLATVVDETLWRWDAGLVLRERGDFRSSAMSESAKVATSGQGARAQLSPGPRLVFAPSPTAPTTTANVAEGGEPRGLVLGDRALALAYAGSGVIFVEAWDVSPLRRLATLELRGAGQARVRLQPKLDNRHPTLLVADDLGRVVGCDLASGALAFDLRT
jgi:hypothetical protein